VQRLSGTDPRFRDLHFDPVGARCVDGYDALLPCLIVGRADGEAMARLMSGLVDCGTGCRKSSTADLSTRSKMKLRAPLRRWASLMQL